MTDNEGEKLTLLECIRRARERGIASFSAPLQPHTFVLWPGASIPKWTREDLDALYEVDYYAAPDEVLD